MALEEKERQVMDAIEALGPGWHDRQDIAKSMGKERLNPSEVAALEVLVRDGKVEHDTTPTKRQHILRSIYRIKGQA